MLHKLFAKRPVPIIIQGGPFRGARVFLNPANSKRKIFGLYEYVLNEWISTAIKDKQFAMDIGANTGYETYGFAYLLSKNDSIDPIVVAFEPESYPELITPQQWDIYSNCRIEIIKKFVGATTNEQTITVDDAYLEYADYCKGRGLIKMDIEGAEVEALKGATNVLDDPRHSWLIEIHGKEIIPEVARYFVDRNRPFLIKELSPLPLIGPERRFIYTTWLVTI